MAEIVDNYQDSEQVLSFPLEGKTVLWLRKLNNYIIAENGAAEIIKKLVNGSSRKVMAEFCMEQFNLTEKEANSLVQDYRNVLGEKYKASAVLLKKESKGMLSRLPLKFYSAKYYSINNIRFSVQYETEYAEFLNHPKFAHHEISASTDCHHKLNVLDSGEQMSLMVDDKMIGSWKRQENHFLSGKFSMEILQLIHQKEEDNWLGVLHAAGVSNGKNCIIFFGDSGNGKSTLSAILMAKGFNVLADDFLPIEKRNCHVCKFPSAISVKKEAFDLLMPIFPQLIDAEQYENPVFNKTYRYLAQDDSELISVPAVALVFIKYRKNSGFDLGEFSKIDALTHLIPDSWINPSSENAERFIHWISSLKCYRLTYSDNEKLISFVTRTL